MYRKVTLYVIAFLLGLGYLLLVYSCSPAKENSLLTRARQLAGKIPVCVDNQREIVMRVEILDGQTGEELADIPVRAFTRECEWVPPPQHGYLTARINSVSVGPDVIPPQWDHVLVPEGAITFRVGADGLTPFAHSSVM